MLTMEAFDGVLGVKERSEYAVFASQCEAAAV
jgi:hypothetical protein